MPALIFLLFAALAVKACAGLDPVPTYKAVINEIPRTGSSGVTGTVVVFTEGDSMLGYAGIVEGLEPLVLLSTSGCTALNGCGVHIHSGFSCENNTLQGGHYFTDPVLEDPWIDARYSSDDSGMANFADTLNIGTDDVEGRAFLVHALDGSRVGCGLLERIPDDDLLVTKTNALTENMAVSKNTVLGMGETSCFFGSSINLESDLLSFAMDGGEDCLAANGCGVHIHSGFSCANSTVQEGHLYNKEIVPIDPWARIGYHATNAQGAAFYTGCVETGVTTGFVGRAFIVHANDGSRVSCGILEAVEQAAEDPAVSPPVEPLVKPVPTYKAMITGIPDTDSNITGTVVVFAEGDTVTGYAGIVEGLQPLLFASNCTAVNGCGVHIHSGFSCENNTLQGGHYFTDPVLEDPWVNARYSSDDSGMANFADTLNIGSDDVEGRAFLVHAEDGSRIGCGLLERVPTDDLLVTMTDALTEDMVVSTNTVFGLGEISCFFGSSTSLQSNLLSSLNGGDNCTAVNGCGVHIHSGYSCANTSVQGGHLYNKETLAVDPWLEIGYLATDAEGAAFYTGCVDTGTPYFKGRAFIVHANDGSRVSCGRLEAFDAADTPVSAPVRPPETSAVLSTSNVFPAFAVMLALVGL